MFFEIDRRLTEWFADNGVKLLRISIGIIFVWFGGLKFFPGLSPAEGLALSTIDVITFGLMSHGVALVLLATLEVAIGIGLLAGRWMRFILLLLILQMIGTMSPVVLFPEIVFTQFPYGLTIEGQYIFKNFVVISAAMVIGATVRGGGLVAKPLAKKFRTT